MEKEAKVTATIKLEFRVPGELSSAIERGEDHNAHAIAHGLVENTIECCGYAGDDMRIEEVEYELMD